jgi:hypothetical protein
MKEPKEGYVWVSCGPSDNDGYWSKIDKKAKHEHKLPFFCPYEECNRPTGTIDDSYMLTYGICKHCYVMLVEDRTNPLIDVNFYRDRLKERGY